MRLEMITKLISFVKKELKHVYLKKLEQLKAELEYDISLLEPIKDKGGMWFTQWNEKTLKLDQVNDLIKAKKQEYGL